MHRTRRWLVLILSTSSALPFGAAVATAVHQGTVQQAGPRRGATPPPQALAHHPPRPDLTPASRIHGVPEHLSPEQVQALAQAKQPPTSVATASATPAASGTPTPTPSASATGTATPQPGSPTPHASPSAAAGH
jgi:hypothetical protein